MKDVNFDQAQRGDLIQGKSDKYNGGKQFTGRITRIRGESISFTTKNGRSRQMLNIGDWTECKITHYGS